MITWRGWGIWVPFIGAFPFLFTLPFALEPQLAQGGLPQSITGYFVWPLLISAALTWALARFLARTRGNRRHDFMSIQVSTWAVLFAIGALIVAAFWVAEKLGIA